MSNNLNATHPEPDQGKKKLTAEQVKQLIHHSSKEVTEQRLKEILEAELQKPEDEIDLQLVDDILAELNPMEVSQSEADASWERLEQRIDQNGKAEKADVESTRETPKHTGKPLHVFLRRAALAATVDAH